MVPKIPTIRNEMAARGIPVEAMRVEEHTDYLLDAFIESHRNLMVRNLLIDVLEDFGQNNDHEAILQRLASASTNLLAEGVRGSREADLTQNTQERLDEYLALRDANHGDLVGLPAGFSTIDRATLGLQPKQLGTLVATPKVGKSILTLQIARTMHEQGKKPLFVTYEMSIAEQARRFDGIISEVAHRKLANGQLLDREVRALSASLKRLEQEVPFIVVDDPALRTVPGVLAKVEQHQPDVVFIDGVYLMSDDRGEQSTPGRPDEHHPQPEDRRPAYEHPVVHLHPGAAVEVGQEQVGHRELHRLLVVVLPGLRRRSRAAEGRGRGRSPHPQDHLFTSVWEDPGADSLRLGEDAVRGVLA